jgi:hypothetical protein
MQEVVKRMQERQQAAEPPKKIGPVNLCLVDVDGDLYPVMLPASVYLNVGDVVVFETKAMNQKSGKVVFFDSVCQEDDRIWTLMTVATGMAPNRAVTFFKKGDCEWKEEES